MKKSPLQQVRDEFGSKAELASKLVPLLDRRDGESDDEFERRIRTSSNRQLLRLWRAEERVKSDFGGKDKLVDAIVAFKFGASDPGPYRGKLMKQSKTRLLDLHDSLAKRSSKAGS